MLQFTPLLIFVSFFNKNSYPLHWYTQISGCEFSRLPPSPTPKTSIAYLTVSALCIRQCHLLIAPSKNYWFSKCHNSHSLLHVFFQGLTILSQLYVSHRHTQHIAIAGVAILVLIAWFWSELRKILKQFLNVFVWAATDGSPRLIAKWTELEAGT